MISAKIARDMSEWNSPFNQAMKHIEERVLEAAREGRCTASVSVANDLRFEIVQCLERAGYIGRSDIPDRFTTQLEITW